MFLIVLIGDARLLSDELRTRIKARSLTFIYEEDDTVASTQNLAGLYSGTDSSRLACPPK
jgi:hypothetical protein